VNRHSLDCRVQRLAVMGISGGGKSTLAVRLGEALDLPVHHLDTIQWRTGTPAEPDEFRAAELKLIAQDRWIIDGNYLTAGAIDERLRRADAVVVVHTGRLTALGRVTRRYLRQRIGSGARHGNPPRLSPDFIRWIWNWRRTHPDFVESLRRRVPHTPVLVVDGSRDALRALTELPRQAPSE
jgi:adenylate kinase family enzyme